MAAIQLLTRRVSLLGQRDFRLFWTAQSVSFLGDQVTLIALPLVAVLAVHATTAQIGYLATAATLPMLLFGVHAGGWVDRWRRLGRVLVAADLARVLLLASIPVAYALGVLSMAQLYAVAAMAGTAAVLFDVGAATAVPALVPARQRNAGNSLLRGSYSFSWVAGPGLGGLLVQLATAPGAILFDTASFLVSAALIRTVHIPQAASEQDSPPGVAAGMRFIARNRVLRPYLTCCTVLSLCYAIYFTLLMPFAVRDLHLSSAQIGFAVGTGAVGALAGSVLTSLVTRRLGVGHALILGSLVYAAALFAIPFAPRTHPWAACATIAAAELVSGFGLMLNNINGLSMQQTVTPLPMPGRVSGASLAASYGARALAGLAAAAIGTQLGLGPAITLAAALGVASIAILIASPVRTMRQLPGQASPDESAQPGSPSPASALSPQ
jgi:MFS family permease